jgi:uncharacterized protein (DUF4415 family)
MSNSRLCLSFEAFVIRQSLADPEDCRTDWDRVRSLTDEDIAQAVADDPDAAPILDEAWLAEATRQLPTRKQITLRLDEDVIEFFRQEGDRYQTRMNAVLRAFMEHARRAR